MLDYSIEPFYKNKCIFVHIPKCAGVSVSKSLFGNLAGGHRTIRDYQKIFTPMEFESFFKFCFVRNPWDRLVSAFHFLKNGGMNDMDKHWFSSNLIQFKNFESFVNEWVIYPENKWAYIHFFPQYYYIYDDNQCPKIDFIGDFENLNSDYTFITKKLGVGSNLILSNASVRKDYRVYYNSETMKIVGNMYEDDIRLFDYFF